MKKKIAKKKPDSNLQMYNTIKIIVGILGILKALAIVIHTLQELLGA